MTLGISALGIAASRQPRTANAWAGTEITAAVIAASKRRLSLISL
jgi:hypothetical protein